MRRRFATLDVFTDRRFAGNPLAVVLEGQGLEGDAMQAIAREFGPTAYKSLPTRRTRPSGFGIASTSDDVIGEGANIDLFAEDVSIHLGFKRLDLIA